MTTSMRYLSILFTLIALITPSEFVEGNKLTISGGSEYPLIHSGIGKKEMKISIELDSCYSNLQITAIVKEFKNGKKIIEKSRTLHSVKYQDIKMIFAFTQFGFYEYEVFLTDKRTKQVLIAETSNISIVPNRKKVGPSDFGICTHFGQGKGHIPYSLDLIKLAGFSSIRDEVYWGEVEKKIGTFYFDPMYDKYINATIERGLRILMILDYGNPAPGELTAHAGFPLDESGRKRFARYATEMVTRYKDKIFLWELWNEPSSEIGIKPDGAYYDLLKETYEAVKTVQPESEFICSGGAPNLVDGAFVNPIFHKGGAKFMDGFAMHTYVAPFNPEDGYETKGHSFLKSVSVPSLWPLYGRMSEQQSKEHKKTIHAWITEMGWHITDSYHTDKGETINIDELRQAAYATRLFLLSRRYNTTRGVYLYDFQNDGVNLSEREHNFGIIRKDYSPKATYSAMSVLSHLLQNKQFLKAIKETNDTKIFCYGDENEELIALWSVNHYADSLVSPVKETTIDLGRKKIKWIDWQGRTTIIRSANGKYTLPVTQIPSYIVY